MTAENVVPIGTGYRGALGSHVCLIPDPADRYSSVCLQLAVHDLCDAWARCGWPCECDCHPAETPGRPDRSRWGVQ